MQADGKKQGAGWRNAQPVSDYVTRLIDPLVRRRAGMTLDLIASWPDIVGEEHASHSRPQKLDWPRSVTQDEAFQPATLVVACVGGHALYLQHETTVMMRRVNAYFGFAAVDRIRFVQTTRTKRSEPARRCAPTETPKTAAALDTLLADVEDEHLRTALRRMGRGVFSGRSDGSV